MAQALGGKPSKFEQTKSNHDATGKPYYISTHPYYSTVAFRWELKGWAKTSDGQYKMFFELVEQEQQFFAYGLRDNVKAFGLGDGTATDAHTNLLSKHRTNQEDVVIEGLSATCLGHRIRWAEPRDPGTTMRERMLYGKIRVHDPGAFILPPEVASPMLLEQGLYGEVAKSVSLSPNWNRKSEDHIGLLRLLPEGGATSYLRANGEPTHHNFYRLPEGWDWLREGSPEDTHFAFGARVDTPVAAVLTLPPAYHPEEEGNPESNMPREIHTIVQMNMHCRSFYFPSANV